MYIASIENVTLDVFIELPISTLMRVNKFNFLIINEAVCFIYFLIRVFLYISTKKQELPLVSALEELVRTKVAKLVVIDLVAQEYERNKEEVANKTAKRLSQEFKQVKAVVSEFAKNKAQTIEVLNDINARLPLLTDANFMQPLTELRD